LRLASPSKPRARDRIAFIATASDKANSISQECIAATILLLAILLTAVAYAPGLAGPLHFDDWPNLYRLAGVHDRASALSFVTNGTAGPTGRPLALASFLPQAYAWPDSPDTFLWTNIALHLLNGVLAAWVLFSIGVAIGRGRGTAAFVATASAALWLLMPILASSSLLVVQRMTTLSASFLLLGFIGYLQARQCIERRPLTALTGMTASVLIGTTLATLSKENGILLPVLILVAESTVLGRPLRAPVRIWRAWQAVFLILPAVVLAAYLVQRAGYGERIVLMRGFTTSERLLTEAQILWQYLFVAALPNPAVIGPFHDNYEIARSWLSPVALVSVLMWLVTVTVAIVMRRRAPLLAFAVGWYLGGHALESTTVPLELYFEHRNYIPLIGPVFALAAGLAQLPARWQPLVRLGTAAYALILAAVLWSVTSLWGNPDLAAEMWFIRNPDSNRTVQFLSERYQVNKDYIGARKVLRQYGESHPDKFGVRIQVLLISCVLKDSPPPDIWRELEAGLPKAPFEPGVVKALGKLYDLASADRCPGVDRESVHELAKELEHNRTFLSNAIDAHNLHILLAREGLVRRDLDMTMHHLEAALASYYAMPTIYAVVDVLTSAGLDAEAEHFIARARKRKPRHAMRALTWDAQLTKLENAVAALPRSASTQPVEGRRPNH
jgi:protein O-mannosyl-transferase